MKLEGNRMTDRNKLHDVLSEAFGFGEHYGRNLDALNDCLAERALREEVCFLNFDVVREHLGNYANKLLEVFEDNGFTIRFIDESIEPDYNECNGSRNSNT